MTSRPISQYSIVSLSAGLYIPAINLALSPTSTQNVRISSADFISGGISVANTVSAAGTDQGGATLLSSLINRVSTCAPGAGVRLAAVASWGIGTTIKIRNDTSNTLRIYPATGDTIAALSANIADTLAPDGSVTLVKTASTAWYYFN